MVFLGLWSFRFLQQRKKFQEWRPGLFNLGLDSAGYGSLGNCPVLGGSFTYGDFRPLEPDLREALLRHWQCLDSWRWDALAWEANEGYGGGKHFQTT